MFHWTIMISAPACLCQKNQTNLKTRKDKDAYLNTVKRVFKPLQSIVKKTGCFLLEAHLLLSCFIYRKHFMFKLKFKKSLYYNVYKADQLHPMTHSNANCINSNKQFIKPSWILGAIKLFTFLSPYSLTLPVIVNFLPRSQLTSVIYSHVPSYHHVSSLFSPNSCFNAVHKQVHSSL